jgi:pimeloyl-ACP methyl ester carboxylesterase
MNYRSSVFTFSLAIVLLLAAGVASGQVPRSNWAELGGHRLHYYDIGRPDSRDALVFIHGWTGNTELWKGSYSAFPKYRVIVVDLLGHGQSDKPTTEYTMELFAKGVDAVLKKAKVKKAIFVGHSMGMPIARQYYRLYPGKTLGIVNVDGSIRAFPDSMQFDGFLASFRSDYQKTRDGFIDSMLAAMKDDALKLAIRSSNQATPDHVGISAISQFAKPELWKTDKIKVPVLAVMAESPWWPADTEVFHRSIAPDLEFHMWKGVTHFLMMERPAEFNETVADWIDKRKLL